MTLVDMRRKAAQLEGIVERRFVTVKFDDFELRATGKDTLHFTGYASLFDEPYDMWGGPDDGGWTETVDPGAFTRTLSRKPDVVLNLNHGDAGSGLPIARTTAPGQLGKLVLVADKRGLLADAPELPLADPDVQLLNVKRDLVNQMSFAFRTVRQEWNYDDDTRLLLELDLNHGDVSIVTNGAQPKTSAELRALLARLERRDADDSDPAIMAQAIDAAIDAALKCLDPADDDYNVDQAGALISAASLSCDALLTLLGAVDAGRKIAHALEARTTSTLMTVAHARRAMLLDA